jgi:hypothetical protein
MTATAEDYGWILLRPVRISTADGCHYRVESLDGLRHAVLAYIGGILTFDGRHRYAEEFAAFLGMIDAADESADGIAVFEEEEECAMQAQYRRYLAARTCEAPDVYWPDEDEDEIDLDRVPDSPDALRRYERERQEPEQTAW